MTPRDFHERVNRMAYLMWEAAGRQQGLAMEYWLAAERQVLAMMQTAMDTAMDRMMAPCRAAQPQRSTESRAAAPELVAEEKAEEKVAEAPAAEAQVDEAQVAEAQVAEAQVAEAPAAEAPAAEAPAAAEPAAAIEPVVPSESAPVPVPTEPAAPLADAVPSPQPAIAVEPGAKTAGNGGLVEHRNRPIVRKGWIGQNVTLDLETNSGHYRVPHDVLWSFVKAHKTVESTKTWQQKGEYSWPKIPYDLLEFLSAYSQK